MPELPEVETVKNGLTPYLKGQTITQVDQRRANLRYAFPDNFAARLEGRKILALSRRAKYLLIDVEGDLVWMVHLGMSGRFTVGDNPGQASSGQMGHNSGWGFVEKHDHLIVELSNGARVVYNDPRRFGFMDLFPQADLATNRHLAHIGPEPLGDDFNTPYIRGKLATKKTPIKTALLDQKLVAGLGNIYVCEALWRAGIAPTKLAQDVSVKKLEELVPIIKDVLNEAISAGGSSLKDFVNAEGELGYFQHSWAVYDREGEKCRRPNCKGTIKRITQGGRSSFYCVKHQR